MRRFGWLVVFALACSQPQQPPPYYGDPYARRRMPASAEGVAIYGAPPGEPYLYLAAYVFAPRPVRLAPERPAAGWVAAIYGPGRPPAARILNEWDDGALAVPD